MFNQIKLKIMINSNKRYSIRVNGIQIMEYDSIKKTMKLFRTLSNALSKYDTICIYDRGSTTYLY